jgi:tryptophan-rich sensory protein
MKKTITLFLCILLTLFIGGLGGIATASGVNDWYIEIQKPSFNPPNYLFGPVWTALYLLMGVSFYMILQAPKSQIKTKAIWIFSIQLSLNFAWSFLFFKFHLLGLAFIEIILIWMSILTMIIVFSKINKTAAYLQIPYLLWVSFASVLNGTIWFLNS